MMKILTCLHIGISLFTEGVFREVYKLRTYRVVLPCCTSMSIQHGARKKNGMQEYTPVPEVCFQVPCEIWVCKCWTHPPKKDASPFQALGFNHLVCMMNEFCFLRCSTFLWRGVWLAQQPRGDLMCFLVGKKTYWGSTMPSTIWQKICQHHWSSYRSWVFVWYSVPLVLSFWPVQSLTLMFPC